MSHSLWVLTCYGLLNIECWFAFMQLYDHEDGLIFVIDEADLKRCSYKIAAVEFDERNPCTYIPVTVLNPFLTMMTDGTTINQTFHRDPLQSTVSFCVHFM